MIVIYHSRDLDGYSSGAIVKKKFPDAILFGFDYGQDLESIMGDISGSTLSEHNVIMIDVVLEEMSDMFALAKKCKSLTWIDHHLSAIRKYEAVKDQAPGNFIAVLEDGIAACEGGWKYLFPNEKMPRAIELLGQYDTWRNKDKEKWEMQILPFQYGMRLKCNSAQSFPMELLDGPLHQSPTSPVDKMVERVIQNGHIILEYQAKINETQCKKAFEFEFEGLRAICLNGGGFSSDVFKSVYDESKHDVMMPFQFDGKQWIFSMYTTKDLDLSVIAKKWGGGGHKQACGFQVPDAGLVFTFLNKSESVELHIKQLTNGQISCEMEGDSWDIAKMICIAMMGSVDVAALVCGAVPTYLDKAGLDREGYCKTVMDAKGDKDTHVCKKALTGHYCKICLKEM